MTRYIMPIILIVVSATFFFMVTNPMYDSISTLKSQVSSYNAALDSSKALESQRDQLTAEYNAIDPNNLAKLQAFLPDNVNSIRLILEIEQIAAPYGMTLSNVKYDATSDSTATTTTTATTATTSTVVQGGDAGTQGVNDYGTFNMEFSVSGSYNNFISFTKDLESNLRMIDISSVSFSSDTNTASNTKKTNSAEVYQYDFKINTYWLKN